MNTTEDDGAGGALVVLECTAERLRDLSRRVGVPAETARRLLHLGQELSSHALAAQVLVKSGASRESLQAVLGKAAAILDEERSQGVLS